MNETGPKSRRWFERPGLASKLIYALAAVCLALVVADFFYDRKAHYSWESAPGFYALFGFFSSVVLVIAAKGLQRLLKRDEDYYD